MTLTLAPHRPQPRTESSAVLSADRRYRYLLTRRWSHGTAVAMIGNYPSKACEHRNDASVRRFMGFAKSWGWGALTVGNLNAGTAADSGDLATMDDPIGPENDAYLLRVAREHPLIVLAWGADADPERARAVTSMLWHVLGWSCGSLGILGWTDAGQPRHPLYLRSDTPLQLLTARRHRDYFDLDPRWSRLLADTTDLAKAGRGYA